MTKRKRKRRKKWHPPDGDGDNDVLMCPNCRFEGGWDDFDCLGNDCDELRDCVCCNECGAWFDYMTGEEAEPVASGALPDVTQTELC